MSGGHPWVLHWAQKPLGAVSAVGAPLPHVLCLWGWDTLSLLSTSLREEGHGSCTPSCSRCPTGLSLSLRCR